MQSGRRLAWKNEIGKHALWFRQTTKIEGERMTGTRPTTLFPFERGAMLESYHIFIEVASSGSMSQASSLLDLDVSVISRHVAAIEQ
jgi:hypothetical protein